MAWSLGLGFRQSAKSSSLRQVLGQIGSIDGSCAISSVLLLKATLSGIISEVVYFFLQILYHARAPVVVYTFRNPVALLAQFEFIQFSQ